MRYLVAQEIKSQTKIASNMYAFDLFFLVSFGGICYVFSFLVHSNLKILYAIFCAIIGVFLTIPSSFNKKRRNYQSLLLFLKKDKNVYRPVYQTKENETVNNDKIKKILDILPFKNYDDNHHCYVNINTNRYMDFLKIVPKDLIGASETELELDDLKFAKFYKTYSDDIKFVGINFPVNTSNQQAYIESVMKRTKDKQKLVWLQKKLDEEIYLEKNRTSRECYIMFFADNIESLYQKRDLITDTLGTGKEGLCQKISDEKKHQIYFKICNKNLHIR